MRAKAIIFDWDGVVADSLPVHFKIYKAVEKRLQKKIMPAHYYKNSDFIDLDWRENLKKVDINDKKTWNKISEIYKKESARLNSEIKPFPGMKRIIIKLSKNFKLGIVSNNYLDVINEKLEEWEMEHYFKAIVDGHFKTNKPHPGQLLECMKKLNVLPEETIYIGDMDGDITTGRNADVKRVIAVTYGWHSHNKLKCFEPDAFFHKPEDMLSLLHY
ncbi:MAG: HAD family hydrolase [Nanoarchaeota archaeon]|nr:HAD family hydrolase [Nanoarchaeota archaeon]